jgi:hypothetical protein
MYNSTEEYTEPKNVQPAEKTSGRSGGASGTLLELRSMIDQNCADQGRSTSVEVKNTVLLYQLPVAADQLISTGDL